MAKSVRINYIFNLVNTAVGLFFPIVTFPYITRVIMADGIGRVQFLGSIINYIALLSAVGIPLYAIREIARVRDNMLERNKATVEILLLHLLLTLVGYIIVFVLGFSINRIYNDIWLYLLLSLNIVLNTLGVAWFYQAIEEFGYITIRSLSVRILCLIALFTLVKTKEDLFVYAGITVLSEAGNYLFNFIHLRKYIKIREIPWRELNLFRHFSPALKIFTLNLITSIYVNLDSVMLGFLSTTVAVGYYASVTRLTKALLGIVTTLGTVLLPRLSNYVSSGDMLSFSVTSKKAYSFILTMAFPMVVGLIFSAPQLIPVFCGDEFVPAIRTLRIIAPIILFIGTSSFVGLQVLYSQGKEIYVIIATATGAMTNFVLNLLLIPKLEQDGAAVATCVAEFAVITVMFIIGKKYIPFRVFNKSVFQVVVMCFLMSMPIPIIQRFCIPDLPKLLFEVIAAGTIYFASLIITKNEFLMMLGQSIRNRLVR